jgi:hypothetical protein
VRLCENARAPLKHLLKLIRIRTSIRRRGSNYRSPGTLYILLNSLLSLLSNHRSIFQNLRDLAYSSEPFLHYHPHRPPFVTRSLCRCRPHVNDDEHPERREVENVELARKWWILGPTGSSMRAIIELVYQSRTHVVRST